MFSYRLYLITDEKVLAGKSLIDTVEASVRGGVDLVQYRNKTKTVPEQIEEAGQLKERLERVNVPLIINDHSKVARLSGAAGVHLGQEDQPIAQAREFLPTAWIGISTHTLDQATLAAAGGATYIGVGPIFHARTKSAAERPTSMSRSALGHPWPAASSSKEWPPVGPALFRTILLSLPDTPVFPIGGIDLDNVDGILRAGAHRLAICRAILGAEDPEKAARQFRERLDKKVSGRYGREA